MKLLNGSELVDYIKVRQAKQVRALRQASHVIPRLAIVTTGNNPVIETYMRLKRRYGEDILVEVDVHIVAQAELRTLIANLNADESVQGIILQLPIENEAETDEILNLIRPEKDVDGLGKDATLDPATPMAINWLLAGYSIELDQKKIVIVGNGRLVGAPLARMWTNSGYNVTVVDDTVEDLVAAVSEADVVVTATGVPGLITSAMLRPDVVVVDAGTASEKGKIVGDVAEDVRERHDITITPPKGGVGPLTVAALFDNVIRAARATVPATPVSVEPS